MALIDLDTHVNKALSNTSGLYSVFFGLENEVPRVWMHHILFELHRVEQRGNLPRLLNSYLEGRNFSMRGGAHYSSVHHQTNRVHRARPLVVPFFFHLY